MNRNKNPQPRMPGANPALAQAMMGKRLSSAASKHQDRRTRRNRTRALRVARAIRDAS
jgi:hypothetical protein